MEHAQIKPPTTMHTTPPPHIQQVNDWLNSLYVHTKLSRVELQQIDHAHAKQYVCDMFDLDSDMYDALRNKAAHNYLIVYTGNDPARIAAHMACKSFWQWWNNAYGNRDIAFMQWDCATMPCGNWYNHYLQQHNAMALAITIYPGAAVKQEIKQRGL